MTEAGALDFTLSPRGPAIAERLNREVAIIGGRLAQLLAGSSVSQEGSLSAGQAFLQAMYDAATTGTGLAHFLASPLDRRPPGGPHPLDRLGDRLALSPLEVNLMLLSGMSEEHEGYASILRSLNPRGEPRATAGLAAQLFCQPIDERFLLRETLECGPMVSSGVVRLAGDAPFFEKNLLMAEALWPVLAGVDVWPAGLSPIEIEPAISGLSDWLQSEALLQARIVLERDEPWLLLFVAESENLAFQRATAFTTAVGAASVGFEFNANLPVGTQQLALLHALARGVVPIIKLGAAEGPTLAKVPELHNYPGPAIVCARSGMVTVTGTRPVLGIRADRLSASARRQLWIETLPELAEHAPTLAMRYMLEPAQAAEVACDVRSLRTLNGGTINLDEVAESVRTRSTLSLSAGVKILRPAARWEQLVLPPDRKIQLVEALQRLVHQSRVLEEWQFLEGRPGARGVRMLLSGPPGTGKTLSAEVLAHCLGVDVLVVDIARVVSKWIGETEKNLAEAFDVAERTQAVLLFDEADALFGKRTEVSDAHDRYANLETAYLLSRLERFDGLAILSTNLRQNIDPAFIRRLEFVIEFDEPTMVEREALWRCHLPTRAPVADDVELKEIAALYPIVGGLIRNAAVAAGFLAAAAGTPIGREHVIGAIRREYEKSGKAFPGVPAGMLHR